MIRIELDNKALCTAVENHLTSMGLDLVGKTVDVRIVAGRKFGSTADITISEGNSVTTTLTEEEVPEVVEYEEAEPEEEEIESEDSSPAFGKKK